MPHPARHLALALGLTLGLGAASGAGAAGLTIDVKTDDGEDVHLSLGTGFLSAMVRTFAPIAIDCEEAADDAKVRRLFRELDRAGEPSRGTLRDGDDLLEARRERGRVHLEVTDGDDGDVARITMPWTVARCVLGGEPVSREELARAFDGGTFELRVEDGDEEVEIEVR